VADQFLPDTIFGFDPDLEGYSYDPTQAMDLLDQAGYPGGFSTTLAYRDVWRNYLPNPAATANAIRGDLLAVGIDATVVEYEAGELISKFLAGELDLFLLGWMQDYAHPDNYYYWNLCDSYLGFGPKDVDLCDELDAAREEMDFVDQVPMYQSASLRVHDTLPLLPIVHPRSLLAMRYNVAGLRPSIGGFELFKDVWFASAWMYLPLVVR
jgi:peptide/nickel transport system substrate-binding protein